MFESPNACVKRLLTLVFKDLDRGQMQKNIDACVYFFKFPLASFCYVPKEEEMALMADQSTMAKLIPIHLVDMQDDMDIDFDLYVYLPENKKFILLRRRDNLLEQEVLQKFSVQKPSTFFVMKEDYGTYIECITKHLLQSKDRTTLTGKNVMAQTAKHLLRGTFANENIQFMDQLISNIQEISKNIILWCLRKHHFYKATTLTNIEKIAETGTGFQQHPLNVNTYAVLLALALGHTSETLLADLAMGALLHDVGLSKLPPHVVNNRHDLSKLTSAEVELLQGHPKMGIDLLRERKVKISELTEVIIFQHHERYDGKGYPRGLKGAMVNEFAMLVSFANALDNRLGEGRATGKLPRDIIVDVMTSNESEKMFQPRFFKRLIGILLPSSPPSLAKEA